mmetsp:Transcript_53079/g.124068  ORF Transcript_53079/g.124068 Transcript_53079/m.124068 type:complete len:279 (-) Transcript_53079:240-1076(-)
MADAACDHGPVLVLRLDRRKLFQEVLAVLENGVLLGLGGPLGLKFVGKLPRVVLGIEHEEGCADERLHVGGHEAVVGMVRERRETVGVEGTGCGGEVLHAVDVVHPRGVVVGVMGVVVVIEEVTNNGGAACDTVGRVRLHHGGDAVHVQEGGQATGGTSSQHKVGCLVQSKILESVFDSGVQVLDASEVEVVAWSRGNRPRISAVARERSTVPIRHVEAIAIVIEVVTFHVHAAAARGRSPILGGAEVSVGSLVAERLVVAPASALDGDGPLGRATTG